LSPPEEIAVTLSPPPPTRQTIRTDACSSRRSVAGALIGLVSLLSAAHITNSIADEPAVKVTDESFKCITKMSPVRHFYVDNLHGNLAATVAVATAGRGDYPESSVVQLMPNEVMIKQQKGFNPATRLGVLLHRRIEGRIKDLQAWVRRRQQPARHKLLHLSCQSQTRVRLHLRGGSWLRPDPVTRRCSARCKGPIRAARVRIK